MKTTCPYCGTGCGVIVTTSKSGECRVAGDERHPANFGRLCVKGAALGETLTPQGRLLYPQVDGARVSWDKALNEVAGRLRQIIAEHGPEAVAFYASGQLLTEDYYVANKLMKGFLGVANIDTNSRLCMASAVVGYKRALGADAVPCCYEDLHQSDLVILAGSNTAWAHPVAFQRLTQAKKENPALKVVVIDPRRTATCDLADLHLALKPGSDGALFTGLLNWLAQHGGIDSSMLPHLVGLDETLSVAADWTPEAVADFCKLSVTEVVDFYRLFLASPEVLTLYCMGINQSSSGSDKCNAIINVHLASGKTGRPGSGPFSLTGQPNAMGGREVGGLANQLAAHMGFSESEVDRLRRFWGSPKVADKAGLKAVDLFQAVGRGEIKAVWIMATNPAVSLPDNQTVAQALRQCPLVIVSDVCAQTDTTVLADILLPAQGWGEKNGTVTNSERRISRQRAFVEPAGEAKPDWWILAQVAQRLGYSETFSWQHPAEIFREHAALSGFENHGERAFDISSLAELSNEQWDKLAPIQWPVNERFPQGCARLFTDRRFYHADGKARLLPVQPRLPIAQPSAAYPLIANTGRIRDQWHTMTRTGQVPRLMKHFSEPFCELHPQDAAGYGIEEGDLVRVQSTQGWTICRAKLEQGQQPGTLFLPMHWNQQFCSQGQVDALVAAEVCPQSGQPESKQTAVRIGLWQSDWQATLWLRDDYRPDNLGWWARIPEEQATRWQIAGKGVARDWLLQQAFIKGLQLQIAEADYFHLLGWRDGKLALAFFSDGITHAEAVSSAFAKPPETAAARFNLLSGRAAASGPGKTICSCFGIGEKQILAAIGEGCHSAAELGDKLKCGTNCGSCIPELTQLIARERSATAR
ncbi:molybdopterin-dependent oxidoreductase [Kalamiella sp. sgz302252]|uniref:nitrate reductase n=1 Tax=Pantoea sp. sgz302252 TaxID=3341827 RepID=UPI0036D3B6B2